MAKSCIDINGKTFQNYAKSLGLTAPSAAGIVYLWRAKTGSEDGFPSEDEAKTYYRDQTFLTQRQEIIDFYNKYTNDGIFVPEGEVASLSSVEQFTQLKRVFGEPNVFLVTKDTGENEIHIAKPIQSKTSQATTNVTEEDIKSAKDLLRNKIEFEEGVIEKLQEKIKWNRATQQDKDDLAEFQQKLKESQALYKGLEDGTSEVYINEFGHSQVRKTETVSAEEDLPVSTQDMSKIVLTKEQQTAVDNAVSFISKKMRTGESPSGKKFLLIQGMAGTGKTTIVRSIVQSLEKQRVYPSFCVAALSRKAVHVLSEKMQDLGAQTETLYTLAGADPLSGPEKFAVDENKAKYSMYNLIFVDEASMVSDTIMRNIDKYVSEHPRTVVCFLGDEGQIRPIPKKGERSHKSTIFSSKDMQVENLTKRIRQGENSPILSYADKFWNISTRKTDNSIYSISGETSITKLGALIFETKPFVLSSIMDGFKKAVKEGNPTHVKIVTATNGSVDSWNDDIRRVLFPESPNLICEGDLIIFNEPYKISLNSFDSPIIENSAEGQVTEVSDEYEDDGVKYREISIDLSDGSSVTVRRIDPKDKESLNLHESRVKALHEEAKRIPKSNRIPYRTAWKAYWQEFGKYADISYGYAVTDHKAQGSTYDIVAVDKDNILKAGIWGDIERAEMMYTALTRSRNVSVVVSEQGNNENIGSYTELSETIDNNKSPRKVSKTSQLPILGEFTLHSGGAAGSDTWWGRVGEQYGVSLKHYYHGNPTPAGNVEVSDKEFKEGLPLAYQAAKDMGRKAETVTKYQDLIGRDVTQATRASEIFAIGVLDGTQVKGGTGYAVQIGINLGKPVHVFDQEKNQWYQYDYGTKSFVETETPTLSKDFAGIGTREINDNGLEAIRQVYAKTVQQMKENPISFARPLFLESMPKDASMSSLITRELASQDPGEKPASNTPVKNAYSIEVSENQGNTKKTVTITPLQEKTSQEDKREHIIRLVLSGELDISTRIQIGGESVSDILDTITVLRRMKSDSIFESLDVTTPLSEENLTAEQVDALNKAKIPHADGKYYIPTFTVGFTEYEMSLRNELNNLLGQNKFTQTELREFAKRSVFKVSERISIIQNEQGAVKRLFGNNKDYQSLIYDAEGKEIDYTQMSRIDILNKIGLGTLFDTQIREAIFSPKRTDIKSSVMKNKLAVIYNNFEAFKQLAYDTLINLEEVTLDNPKARVTEQLVIENEDGTNENNVNAETEQELAEVFGSTVEHWQVGFRQVSAFNSLSQLIKNTVSRFYDLNEDGTMKIDSVGMAKTIDTAEAISKILQWTQKATTLEEMVDMLTSHLSTDPWLRQLVGKGDTAYYANGTDNSKLVEGLLVNPEEQQFQSQFFTNFRKYFQSYFVTYLDAKGNVVTKSVNSPSFEVETLENIQSLAQSADYGMLRIWDKDANGLTKDYYRLKEILGTPRQKVKGKPEIAATGLNQIVERLDKGEELTQDLKLRVANAIKEIYEILNIESPEASQLVNIFSNNKQNLTDFVKTLGYLTTRNIEVSANLAKEKGGWFELFGRKGEKINGTEIPNASSNYKAIIKYISPVMASATEAVSYEGGKLYYGYVTPSYLGILVDKLKGRVGKTYLGNPENYQTFMQREYGKYEGWFYNSEDGARGPKGFMNYWLAKLNGSDGERYKGMLEHVTSLTYEGTAYSDKSDPLYYASLLSMYLYDAHKNYSYFRMPTMSNKPSEEYLKFERITENYESTIVNWLTDYTFYQELNRIKAVRDRQNSIPKDQKIDNFDKNGTVFHFLPFLNERMNGKDRFGELLRKVVNGEGLERDSTEAKEFRQLLSQAIKEGLDERFNEYLLDAEKAGFLTLGEKGNPDSGVVSVFQIDKLVTKNGTRKEVLREYFYNDFFATLNILQLTVGDIALYKNAENLQKRLAQLHAPGMRANIQAKDITYKKNVSDGVHRSLIIKDEEVASVALINIKQALSNMLANPKYHEGDNVNAPLTKLGKSLKKKFDSVIKVFSAESNKWTDGQAYSSPTSYRKKMHMYGKWSKQDETAYEKVLKGDFSEEDLNVIWQPLKPFVYSQITRPTGSDAMPLVKTGVQYKNSEFLLVMADALMKSQGVESPLAAIFDAMEESQGAWSEDGERFIPNGKGIDTVQFESCVKTGAKGVISINGMDYNAALSTLRNAIYDASQPDGYNANYVTAIPFDDYTIQQEVPPHFKGEQQIGSQVRIHTIADLVEKENGEDLYVDITTERGGRVTTEHVTVAEAKKRYMAATAENIELSFEELSKELGLDGRFSQSKKFRNIALSRLLKKEILRDGRLGADMLWAVDVNEDGDFNIPLSDPIHSGRLQQLLNSVIKNHINKQEISGGPVVQVSAYGTSEDLNIRFKSENGKLLLSRKEFEQYIRKQKKRSASFSARYVDFKDYVQQVPKGTTEEELKGILDLWYESYVRDNQHSLAYFEAYAPIYDEALMDFADEDGVIDVKAIEKMNPKLLEMIGYRIPTEAKYSIVPIKIVGFLPRNGGEGIMLPADITTLTGSDFDIDKLYIMRYAFRKGRKKSFEDFAKEQALTNADNELSGKELYEEKQRIIGLLKKSKEEVSEEELNDWKEVQDAWNKYKGEVYYTTNMKDKREANNNTILSITQAILTSPQVVDQMFSPGNFDVPKRIGYLIKAADVAFNEGARPNEELGDIADRTEYIASTLEDKSISELKDLAYKKSSLLFANVQVNFHRQNSVAGKLIGVFAQANVSHGFMGLLDNPTFKVKDFGEGEHGDFVLAGHRIGGEVRIDPMYAFDRVTRVSQNLAALLAASVDAVKDPVLNLFNLNMTTVNIAVALIRLGYDIDTIGWLLTTPVIKRMTEQYERDSVDGSTSIESTIAKMKDNILDKYNDITFDAEYDLSVDDLIRVHNWEGDDEAIARMDYQILETVSRINKIANAFRQVTHVTRYNSIAAAVGPFAAHTAVSKIQDINFSTNDSISPSAQSILQNPIIKAFREKAYELESKLIGQNFIQGGEFANNIYRAADAKLGYLNDKTAQKLSDFIMSYVVNIDNPIFDLSDNGEQYHRDMIYETTPDVVTSAKALYPDNKFLKAIRVNKDKHGNKILRVPTRGRDATEIQDLKQGWSKLLEDEAKRLGENAFDVDENLALRLVQYNFVLAGFGFSGKSFMSLVPSSVKQALPNYLQNLDAAAVYNDIHIDRLLEQFMLNNGIANVGVYTQEEFEKLMGVSLNPNGITTFDTLSPTFPNGIVAIKKNEKSSEKKFYKIKGTYLIKVHPLEKLGGLNQGFEIDPSRDVEDMHSMFKVVTPSQSQGEKKEPEKPKKAPVMPRYYKTVNEINESLDILDQIIFADTDNISDRLEIAQRILDKKDDIDNNSAAAKMKKILKDINVSNLSIEQLQEVEKELNLCVN